MKKRKNKILTGCLIVLAAFVIFILLYEFLFSFSLSYKAGKGDIAAVKKALEEGTDINEGWGMFNYTPIHAAATAGKTEMVRFLLDNGAEVDPKEHDEHQTPLIFALEYRHYGTAKLLIERGADVEYAVKYGHFDKNRDVMDFLVSLKE